MILPNRQVADDLSQVIDRLRLWQSSLGPNGVIQEDISTLELKAALCIGQGCAQLLVALEIIESGVDPDENETE